MSDGPTYLQFIARLIEDEGRAIIIGANKWDSVRNRQLATRQISDRIQTSLAQLRGVPMIQIYMQNI